MSGPFANVSARHAALLRVAVFGACAYSALKTPLARFAEFPPGQLAPTGVLLLLPETLRASLFASEAWLTALPLATAGAAAAAAIGLGFRFVAPWACIGLTVVLSIHRSYSFVNHADIELLLSAWVLAVFAWADRFEPAREGEPPTATDRIQIRFLTIAALLTASYAFIGAHRVADGGLAVFLSHPIPAWGFELSFAPSSSWLFSAPLARWLVADPFSSALLAAGFPLVTAFEVLSPLVLASRVFRNVWLVATVTFHILSTVVLNIWFWENLLLIALVVPWVDGSPRWLQDDDLESRRRQRRSRA